MSLKFTDVVREFLLYFLTTVIGLGVLAVSLRLWQADIRIPLYYGTDHDENLSLEMIKSTVEHGWYFTNPYLGAPGTMNLRDFPMLDTLHFATARCFALFVADPLIVFNIFYLGGYPLCVLTSLFVLRHFGVSRPVAAAASLLFAFQPYHFWRGNWHLFLAAYQMIPLGIMVALWIAERRTLCLQVTDGERLRLRPTGRGVASRRL